MTEIDAISELEKAAYTAITMWKRKFRPVIPGELVMAPPEIEAFVVHPTVWREYAYSRLMNPNVPQGEILLLGKRMLCDYELSNFEVQIVVRP